ARGADFAGELVIAPPSAAGSPWIRRFRRAQQGFATGLMRIRGNRRRRNYDRGFVISDHADWPSLLRTVEETGARRVIATHGDTAALVRVLNEAGIDTGVFSTGYGEEDLCAASPPCTSAWTAAPAPPTSAACWWTISARRRRRTRPGPCGCWRAERSAGRAQRSPVPASCVRGLERRPARRRGRWKPATTRSATWPNPWPCCWTTPRPGTRPPTWGWRSGSSSAWRRWPTRKPRCAARWCCRPGAAWRSASAWL